MNGPILLAHEQQLLDRVRETIRQAEPEAHLTLFGPRARGEATPESDWDLLIVLDGTVSPQRDQLQSETLGESALSCDALVQQRLGLTPAAVAAPPLPSEGEGER